MILHNLEFEAFMAYPKRQEINFDTLNNAGVFLLNGPTGAGKTTILDAICYALYGETSSDRESAKLHSTYAAHSGTKPRVLLDVTLHGKRLRIDRTPAYNKPITRGARKGQMREESAKATLAELAPGADPSDEKAWTPISSSVAEVNRTIAERTHLTKEQFLKVVLLPQGQFAQFLKSKPKERKELLKKMFPVEHYEQLFAALTEEAKTAQQEVAQADLLDGGQAGGDDVKADEGHKGDGQHAAGEEHGMHDRLGDVFGFHGRSPFTARQKPHGARRAALFGGPWVCYARGTAPASMISW